MRRFVVSTSTGGGPLSANCWISTSIARVETTNVTADYLGSGYGDPTEATLDAIMRVAETEGILLDPVYSGKTMSGLLDHVASGVVAPGSTVVMVHTGGVPALFAYHEAIEAHLVKRGRI